MEISWTYHVTNVEALQTIKKERNIIQTIKRKAVLVTPCLGTGFEDMLVKGRYREGYK
jgi:hypothetical protein